MQERSRHLGNLLTKMRLAAAISWWALQPARDWKPSAGPDRG
jgi:hypothetical protein